MVEGKAPFSNSLTKISLESLEKRVKDALDKTGFTVALSTLMEDKDKIERQIRSGNCSEEEKKNLEHELQNIKEQIDKREREKKATEDEERQRQANEAKTTDGGGRTTYEIFSHFLSGGCFPASASIADSHGCPEAIDSLKIGDVVQVIVDNKVTVSTVYAFIHRQPEVLQQFLKITTVKGKAITITADHLLFVEKMRQLIGIPARDVKIGDRLHVREFGIVTNDAVQDISVVYDKGVYAPVTLSGTILVNDIHTSCYFDVLSHEWSHRAMAILRALHYASPSMTRKISAIGEKDGFPGWCRLAHRMLTLFD